MKVYIPIPDNQKPIDGVIESLENQNVEVELHRTGEIYKGHKVLDFLAIKRLEIINKAKEKNDEYFVMNDSGILHTNPYGIARMKIFLNKNKDYGLVGLTSKPLLKESKVHVDMECVMIRTEAIKDMLSLPRIKGCDCKKIVSAIKSFGYKVAYLEKGVKHLKSFKPSFVSI